MKAVKRVEGVAAPFPQADIDTDAMIPQRWLVTTTRTGLGAGLFGNWRYHGQTLDPDPQFVLNRPEYRRAKIIVAGPNYGCGSSREHAVWAHLNFGIAAVVAPSFGPIFRDNALRNGLLLVALPEPQVEAILAWLSQDDRRRMSIDLETCLLTGPDGSRHRFSMDETSRSALLAGRDEITATLEYLDAIQMFHERDRAEKPFLWECEQAQIDRQAIGKPLL